MNWLDLGVIGIVVLSAVFAFARGFVREALSIVAWVGAAAATLYGFNWAYAQIHPHVHDALLSQIIAGFGLFVVSLVILTIATGVIARMVHASGLSPIDRTLGFIFGLARGAFVVCLAYLLLDVFVPQTDRPDWLSKAKSEPFMLYGSNMLRTVLPESLRLKGTTAAEDLIRTIDPKGAAKAEAEKAMRALANPTPSPAPSPAANPTTSAAPGSAAAPKPAAAPGGASAPKPETVPGRGYRPGDQRELDRLIGTQR